MPPHAKDGPRVSKPVKFSNDELDQIEEIKAMTGIKRLSEAIRFAIRFCRDELKARKAKKEKGP